MFICKCSFEYLGLSHYSHPPQFTGHITYSPPPPPPPPTPNHGNYYYEGGGGGIMRDSNVFTKLSICANETNSANVRIVKDCI